MRLAIALFGIFMIALGGAGVVAPARLLSVFEVFRSRLGLLGIAAVRLVLGALLLLTASASRAPVYFQVLGAVSLISGAITPFFGEQRIEAILSWWKRQPPALARAWSLAVIAIGASLVWGVFPPAAAG